MQGAEGGIFSEWICQDAGLDLCSYRHLLIQRDINKSANPYAKICMTAQLKKVDFSLLQQTKT